VSFHLRREKEVKDDSYMKEEGQNQLDLEDQRLGLFQKIRNILVDQRREGQGESI
jgi:hypothetical protein